MSKKKTTGHNYHDAGTGQIVTEAYAKAHPTTTVKITFPLTKPTKKSK